MNNPNENPDLNPTPLAPDAKSFIANGTQYFINSNILLSPKRLAYVKEFTLALAYQRDPTKYIKDIQSLDTPLNLRNTEEVNRILERMMSAFELVEKLNYSLNYYICALFINRANEDLNEFDLADAAHKLKDWSYLEADSFKLWAKQFIARLNN